MCFHWQTCQLNEYICSWYRAILIRSSILSAGVSPFIIPEGELVFPAIFMTQRRKTPYGYHDPDEAIPVMMNLKQVVMPLIE